MPITGISWKFTTYSVLNNGVELATGQTATTYTITGLGDNVQIGPVTLVPYDNQGVAGSPTTVRGGSGGGLIYTWAQANTPTFAGTGSDTTLTCTGTFSKLYVTFSGGSASPVSGTLITGTNSISQVYSVMTASTTYTFVVYPVNGDNIISTNYVSTIVKTITPMWIAGGDATSGNSIAYSTNGMLWTGIGNYIFTTYMHTLSYNPNNHVWIGGGAGTHIMAYTNDGLNWTGLSIPILSLCNLIKYNISNQTWFASGIESAYSTDGFNWTKPNITEQYSMSVNCIDSINNGLCIAGGISPPLTYSSDGGSSWKQCKIITSGYPYYDINIFTTRADSVAYNTNSNLWVSFGTNGTANGIARSINGGTEWVKAGSLPTSTMITVDELVYNETLQIFVGTGDGGNSFMYSSDGYSWTGVTGIDVFNIGVSVTYSKTTKMFMATGIDVFNIGVSVTYSKTTKMFMATGRYNNVASFNSIAYSTNGINWTGVGTTIGSGSRSVVRCNC